MKSIARIKMDFAKAKDDADKIDKIASEMRKLSRNRLENSMNELASVWMGANSRMFLTKEQKIQREIEKTAESLNDIASDIRRIAKKIYDAERQACDIVSGMGGR